MSKVIKSKAFVIGFWFGLFLSIAINWFSYETVETLDHGINGFGYPFQIYRWSYTAPFIKEIVWTGIIANILIALIFSFLLGLVLKFLWSKNNPKRFGY